MLKFHFDLLQSKYNFDMCSEMTPTEGIKIGIFLQRFIGVQIAVSKSRIKVCG